MKKCLIYIEHNNYKNAADLVEVANQIYPDESFEVYGMMLHKDRSDIEEHLLDCFDYILRIQDKDVLEEDANVITNIIEEVYRKYDFDSILIPATFLGRMLAPRVAMRLHVGLTADVTAINYHNGLLEMVRPAFSGRIMAAIVKKGQGPIMLSVRQNVFHREKSWRRETKLINYQPTCDISSSFILMDKQEKKESYDISDSKVLISGGGGVESSFSKLDKLAKVLNGDVSASRMIIDKGIATRAIQVGQSGKTVSPKLYIAIGINGAIQHVEGLKNVEHIISVNLNSQAPICSLSDLVVQGDGAEFVDKLLARIEMG